eukprot:SAG22_NODE_2812_length_2187_cov_2.060824_1_plen_134_part_10
MPQSDNAGSAAYPLFGRLRRDFDTDGLAGGHKAPAIVLPVELTRIPPTVSNFAEAANAFRNCVHLCNLLGNQSGSMKNSFLHRVVMITNLFTKIVPVPLPFDHPHRNEQCFWSAQPMRYETQADILRTLDLLSR